jgi:hypothetical protein
MTKNNFNANLTFPLLPPLIANGVPQFGHLHFCTFNFITQLSLRVPSITNGFLFKKRYRLSGFCMHAQIRREKNGEGAGNISPTRAPAQLLK